MSKTVRLSIRLDPTLKQTLTEQSEATGIPVSRLVIQAIETYLAQMSNSASTQDIAKITELETALQALQHRVYDLESWVQASPSAASSLPSTSPQRDPDFALIQAQAHPPGSTSEPTTDSSAHPHLWDPLQASFEDWVFQSWMDLATQQTGSEDCWGHIIPVEVLHQHSFYSMRLPRFVDRLMAAEVPELQLISDPPGISCRPTAITYHWDNQSLLESTHRLPSIE